MHPNIPIGNNEEILLGHKPVYFYYYYYSYLISELFSEDLAEASTSAGNKLTKKISPKRYHAHTSYG